MKKRIVALFFIFSLLFVSAAAAAAEDSVRGWSLATNKILSISQPDKSWEYLGSKNKGYKCFSIETEEAAHRIECLSAPKQSDTLFYFKMDFNKDGVLQTMYSVCLYLAAPSAARMLKDYNDAIEAFVEGTSDIKNHKETEDIQEIIAESEKYSAYDAGGFRQVFHSGRGNSFGDFFFIVREAVRTDHSF